VEHLTAKWPYFRSLIALQQYLREDFFAAVSTELGGGNTAVALSVAANMGIPIVDGDPVGRSVPELQHTIFFLKGVSIVPLGVATKSGDVVIVKEVANHIRAEKIVRSIAVASGGTVGVTDHPMRGKELKAAIIAGAISHAETIGAVLKTTSDYEKVAEAIKASRHRTEKLHPEGAGIKGLDKLSNSDN